MRDSYTADTIHQLIQKIYLAGVNTERWPEFLAALSDAVDGGSSILSFIDIQRGGAAVNAAWGITPEVIALYHERYAAIDPYGQGTAALGPLEPGFVGLCQDIVTEEQLLASDFYQQFGKAHGMIGGLVCVIYADGPLRAVVGVNRKPGQHFGAAEVALFKVLYPHVRTSLQIHRELLRGSQLGRAALATLNRMRSATFVCDSEGRVLHVNATGKDLATKLIRGDQFELETPAATARLRAAIGVAARSVMAGAGADQRLTLTSSGGKPHTAIVAPVHQQDVVRLIEPLVAVIVQSDDVPSSALEQTAKLFAFTPAEARAALVLLEGGSVRELAMRLSVTYESARTLVKRLLAKTGSRRQAELVRTLLTTMVD
jgi:DNA-binding CsgD family transcriptional regulator